VSCARASVPTLKASVSTNNAMMSRMVLSRSSVVAMMRGVSWALAIWIATSSELKANTMKATVAETTLSSVVSTVATSSFHDQVHCSRSSSQPTMRIRKNEMT
jgi:hypothetical protein